MDFFYDEFAGGSKEINIKDGFVKLINYSRSNLNEAKQIHLNELVTNIEYAPVAKSSGIITVTSRNSLPYRIVFCFYCYNRESCR